MVKITNWQWGKIICILQYLFVKHFLELYLVISFTCLNLFIKVPWYETIFNLYTSTNIEIYQKPHHKHSKYNTVSLVLNSEHPYNTSKNSWHSKTLSLKHNIVEMWYTAIQYLNYGVQSADQLVFQSNARHSPNNCLNCF